MKKNTQSLLIRFLLCILLFILVFSACDSGLKYVKMEILSLPEKTTYEAGTDRALRFDGGLVRLTTADGSTSVEDLQSYTYQNENVKGKGMYITSDVDFSAAGVYTVTVWQTEDLFCQYTVEVQAAE